MRPHIDTSFCFNLAMSDDGNYTYMTAWGVSNPNPGSVTTTGNLYTSPDKGVTWTKITPSPSTAGGAATPSAGTSWASIPSQVRCNSTGEYVILGTFSSTASVFLLSYGQQILINPTTGAFGGITSNPVITNRASDNALIASVCGLAQAGNRSYSMFKCGYQIAGNTAIVQSCSNTPLFGGIAPQTTSVYITAARNVCMAQDRNQIVVVDTAGLGNVFVTSNGLQSAPWPDSSSFGGISCFTDIVNLSIPNAVSQVAVPRSAWSGVCVNYNDQFAFANRTGTVYLYTWTLQ